MLAQSSICSLVFPKLRYKEIGCFEYSLITSRKDILKMRQGVSSRNELYPQAPEYCGEARTLEIDRPRKLTRFLHATKHARFLLAISARCFSWIAAVSRRMCYEYKKCTTTNVRMRAWKSGIQCANSGTLIHRELFVSHISV